MQLHLTPRYYKKYADIEIALIDVVIPELGLELKEGADITVKNPYPNKSYQVICRKKDRKAINGILLQTDIFLENFTVITRWAVNGEISTHTVHYHVTDSMYDTVSEDRMLWNGRYGTSFVSRYPENERQSTVTKRQAAMITLFNDFKYEDGDSSWVHDETDAKGIVRTRTEYVCLPTIEPARLTSDYIGSDRVPQIADAFAAVVSPFAYTIIPSEFKEFGVNIVPLAEWIELLRNDGESDLQIEILNEALLKNSFFFSNTNHLLNIVKNFSPTYCKLDKENKSYIDTCLTRPVFHIYVEDE